MEEEQQTLNNSETSTQISDIENKVNQGLSIQKYEVSEEILQQQIKDDARWKDFNTFFDKQTLKKVINSQNQFNYFSKKKDDGSFNDDFLAGFSIHGKQDEDYLKIKELFQKGISSPEFIHYKIANPIETKCMAAFLGNAVGDALGAHTEFIPFTSNRNEIKENWDSLKEWAKENNQVRTEFGVITDDCSMARCMADSFLSNNLQFNPIDMRMRFLMWWNLGYCNGTLNSRSFGLGGNISVGFNNFFKQNCPPFVVKNHEKERGNISGNGGIMRLSPIPIVYHDDIEKGEKIAVYQSLTTHNGEEAAELCKLLTHAVIKLINYRGENPKKDVLEKLGATFETSCTGVQAMARSMGQKQDELKQYDQNWNKSIEDRYWNWQDPKLKVSPTRVRQQPGYFGSYAMDGAYVALHIVYHSNSFIEAIFKAVNWGGDADSVAAVVGYLCGAIYGLDKQILQLYEAEMVKHDQYSTFVKAMKLFNKKPIQTQAKYFPQKEDFIL